MRAVPLAAAGGGPSTLWYATRATGVVALVLLTATVLLGIAGTARLASPGLPRAVTAGLHRNVSLLVVCLVAVHVVTAATDSYARISLAAAVVPFSSPYRRLWLGLGAVAFDLLAAVVLTSLMRDRLSYRTWRLVHWLGYACWPIALWHGLGTGSDTRLSWLLGIEALCAAAVVAAACWRLSLAAPGALRTSGLAGTLLLPLGTVAFVMLGPLQPGWARRAGTPTALLGSAVTPGAGGQPSAPASAVPGAALSGMAAFAGRVRRSAGPQDGEVTITVAARIRGAPWRTLTIVLSGPPSGDGLTLTSGSVRLAGELADGRREVYRGPVTMLHADHLTAALDSGQHAWLAHVTLVIRGTRASGDLRLDAA